MQHTQLIPCFVQLVKRSGHDALWVHNAGRPFGFGALRKAYIEACAKIGGCAGLPKSKEKWGGAMRGDQKCGIRLDPPDTRRGWHINYWNYTGGKRKNGCGCSGHSDL